MKITIQLIQNHVLQECPSIIINCNSAKYVFNVPSSFQRFLKDHKIGMNKGFTHFFTKTSTQTMAGLDGLLLRMFQSASSQSKLFINRPMFQYLQDTRYKMGRKILPISYCQWKNPKQRNRIGIRDKVIMQQLLQRQNFYQIFDDIDAFIRKQIQPENINDASICYSPQIQGFKDKYLQIIPFFVISEKEEIINFVCRTSPVKGKVLIEKIRQFGIPERFIKKILEVETFKLSNSDRIIHTSEIKQPDSPGRLFFILHINSIQSIEKILIDETFNKFTQNQAQFIDCVIFIVQQTQYLLSEQFRRILNVFPLDCNHIIQAPNIVDKNFRIDAFMKQDMMLVSRLHKRFSGQMPDIARIQQNFMQKYQRQSKHVQHYFDGYKVNILQRSDQINILPLRLRGIVKNTQKSYQINHLKELRGYLHDFNQKIHAQLPFKPQKCDPKVIFLGTGSMLPSKYRNVSSILVQYDQNNSFLMDCGQSSMYQMINHYPIEEADQRLLNVRIIFITHMHSDHSLGILDIISRRNRLMKKYKDSRRIFLIIPCNMFFWYSSFLKHIEDLSQGCDLLFTQSLVGQKLELYDHMFKEQLCKKGQSMSNSKKSKEIRKTLKSLNQEGQEEQQIKTKKYLQKIQSIKHLFKKEELVQPQIFKSFKDYLKSINVSSFHPTRVIHCPQSYGIIIQNKQANVKISYSGDTLPFNGFAHAARNSTLMIHQATYGDDRSLEAKDRFHSTVGQAIKIGMKSKSWKTALTHFSQRYQNRTTIIDSENYVNNKQMQNYLLDHTVVCFDHLQFKLSDGAKLPQISQSIYRLLNQIE